MSRRTELLALVPIVAVALFFRMFPSNSGLPDTIFERHDETHYVSVVADFLQGRWKVEYFVNPTLPMYLMFGVTWVIGAAFVVAGRVHSWEVFSVQATLDPALVTLVGRWMAIVAGVLAVVVLYDIGRRLFSGRVGLAAALVLAVDREHALRSAIAGNEALLVLFILLGFRAILRYLEEPTTARHLACGLFLGLAASTKYTGGLLVVPLLVASVVALARTRGDSGAPWFSPRFFAGFLLGPLAFVATSPWVVLNWETFLADFGTISGYLHEGFIDQQAERSASGWRYYVEAFPEKNAGLPWALLCAGGLLLLGYRAVAKRDHRSWLLLAAILPAYLVLGSGLFFRMRFLLPAIPFILVAGAELLDVVLQRLKLVREAAQQSASRSAFATILPALITLPLIAPAARANHADLHSFYGAIDGRADIVAWVRDKIDPSVPLIELNSFGAPLFNQHARATRFGIQARARKSVTILDELDKFLSSHYRADSLARLLGDAPTLDDLKQLIAEEGYGYILFVVTPKQLHALEHIPSVVNAVGVRNCDYWPELIDWMAPMRRSKPVIGRYEKVAMVAVQLPNGKPRGQ